jgi:hypothetical protein
MKLSFRDFFRALTAPVYAVFMLSDHEPKPQDTLVWFLLWIALGLIATVADIFGWHQLNWERFSNVALFACLVCRLHFLECEIERIDKRPPTTPT